MKDILSICWKEEKILGSLDCFVNKEGKVVLLNCSTRTINEEKKYICYPFCDTTVESLEKYNKDIWFNFDVFSNKVIMDNGDIIFGGEGEMGNEGFVVCTNNNNDFLWSLFFINSNPFYKIEIIDQEVHAFSSYDLVYKINLNDPSLIKIEEKEWR